MTHFHRFIPACLFVAACSSDPVAPSPAADATVAEVSVTIDAPAAVDVPVALDTPDVPAAIDAPLALDTPDAPAAIDAPAGAPPYPGAPYGNRVGTVLANLTWEGYVNPTGEAISNTLPYSTTSLQALRGNARGYAMVHVSEFL
jgi:hypothetical protein